MECTAFPCSHDRFYTHTHTQSHPREYTCSSYFSTKYIILQLFKAALRFSAHEISAKENIINVFSLRAVATNAKQNWQGRCQIKAGEFASVPLSKKTHDCSQLPFTANAELAALQEGCIQRVMVPWAPLQREAISESAQEAPFGLWSGWFLWFAQLRPHYHPLKSHTVGSTKTLNPNTDITPIIFKMNFTKAIKAHLESGSFSFCATGGIVSKNR